MSLRILHVFDHSLPLHSGYTFRSLSILREQRKLGWETFHLTSPKHAIARADEEEIDGWHFFRTRLEHSALDRLPAIRELRAIQATARRLEDVVRRVRPHLVHAHSPVLNALPALRVGRRLGIPVVYEVRAFWEDAAVDHGTSREWGVRYRLTRQLETYALNRADRVTTICEGLRGEMVSRGVPAAKITVIPNAVDVGAFSFDTPRDAVLGKALGLDGRTVVGFVGSFYAYEGLDLLLKALPALVAARPEVRLLLVGGGPQEAHLKALARELGVADLVVFAGRVPHQEVPRYYSLMDVLAYPRYPMRLTDLVTPLKPLEAMAQGHLVVASDVGGHRELIRDGENGVLFSAGSVDALAEAVAGLLSHPDRWPELRRRGRRYVEQERNWARSVARYGEVFEPLWRGAR
jgi:PEP-CTERM/exosortase A-associated glycosyltransferase